MSNTGTLRIGLNVESDKLVKGLNLGTKQIRKFTRDASRDFSTFSNNTIDSITDIVDALSSLSGGLSDFSSSFADISKEAKNSGIALQEFIDISSAFKYAGGDISNLTGIITHMKDAIADAKDETSEKAKQLNKIGLSFKKLDAVSVADQFRLIAKGIEGVASASERSLLSSDLLSGSFEDARGVFAEYGGDVDKINEKVEELGLSLNKITVETFTSFQKEITTTGQVLKNLLADGLVPVIDKLTEFIKSTRDWSLENKELTSNILIGTSTVLGLSVAMAGLYGLIKLISIPFKLFISTVKKLKVPMASVSKNAHLFSNTISHFVKIRRFVGLTNLAGTIFTLSTVIGENLLPKLREYISFKDELTKSIIPVDETKSIIPVDEATLLAIDNMYKEAEDKHKKYQKTMLDATPIAPLNTDEIIKQYDKLEGFKQEVSELLHEIDPIEFPNLYNIEKGKEDYWKRIRWGANIYTDLDDYFNLEAYDKIKELQKERLLFNTTFYDAEKEVEEYEKFMKELKASDINKIINKNIADDILFEQQQKELEKQKILEQAKEHKELKLVREQEAQANREIFSYSISQALVTGLESGGVKGAIRSFAEVLRDSARESLIQGISESINQSIGKDIGASALSFFASIITGSIFGGGGASSKPNLTSPDAVAGVPDAISGAGSNRAFYGGVPDAVRGFNDGGIVQGHGTMDRVPAMLTAGEIVINPRKTDLSQLGSKTTNITYNIHAVDSRSFQQLVAEDPEFIHNVAQQGQRDTTSLRRT